MGLMPDANVDKLMMLVTKMVKFVHQRISFLTSLTNIIVARFEINCANCIQELLYYRGHILDHLLTRAFPSKHFMA